MLCLVQRSSKSGGEAAHKLQKDTHMHTPDKWAILKIQTKDDTIYKVIGSWRGGYLDGDSWRANSGITFINDVEGTDEDISHYLIHGYSGSIYKCYKECTGMSFYTSNIVDRMIQQGAKSGHIVSVVDIDEYINSVHK